MMSRIRVGVAHVLRFLPTLTLLLLLAAPAWAADYQIDATAQPARLNYGKDNNVNLVVIVHDGAGALAADGTSVYFRTTLGMLPALAYTRQGRIDILLSNTTGPGTADITITVGATQRHLEVDYLGQGEAQSAQPKRPSYTIAGQTLTYNVDHRLFEAYDHASLRAPGYALTADTIQYNVTDGLFTAQGHITISGRKKQVTAEKARIEISSRRGSLVQVEDGIHFKSINLADLSTKDDDGARSAEYHMPDTAPTRTWIVSREATVFPNEFIQFRRPHFYLNDFNHSLMALPYHVLDLRSNGAGTFFNADISLASDAGLNVDFPVYLQANRNNIESLHLRQVTQGSQFYHGQSGMQMSLEDEYRVGDTGDGGLFLDDIARQTRGVTWDHRQDFGLTRLNMNASYSRTSDTTPYTTNTGLTLSRAIGKSSLYFNTNYSLYQGTTTARSDLSFALPPLPLRKTGFSLGFTPFISLDQDSTPASSTVQASSNNVFTQGLRSTMSFPVFRLLGGSLSTNVNDEISHDSTDLLTNYLDSSVNYSRQLGRHFQTSLSYAYSLSHSNQQTTTLSTGAPSQRLSLNLSGSKQGLWTVSAYSSYTVGSNTMYNSGAFTYYLPWNRGKDKMPCWATTANFNLTTGGTTLFDQSFALSRNIGAYSLVLHYSPNGNTGVVGIGGGTGKNWALELARQGW